MNKKFLICFLCLFAVASFGHPEKLGKLNEIVNPFMIRVDSDKAYISDQYYVLFYSLSDLKLLKKVGGKGEGPANFIAYPNIRVLEKSIIAYSVNRLTYFSKSSKSLGDKKFAKMFFLLDYTNGNFVMPVTHFAEGKVKNHLTQYTVFDSDFNEIKVIHSIKKAAAKPQGKVKKFLISPLTTFQCYDGKIYLVDGQNGFQIKIFDHQGKLIKQIQREYEKIEIPESVKKEKYKDYINTPAIKKRLHVFNKLYEPAFPEHFPPIRDFRISDRKMYIKTYKNSGGKTEFIILDLSGKLLGKTYLPDIRSSLFDIVGNRFYFLQEDENEVYWELHSTKIQ